MSGSSSSERRRPERGKCTRAGAARAAGRGCGATATFLCAYRAAVLQTLTSLSPTLSWVRPSPWVNQPGVSAAAAAVDPSVADPAVGLEVLLAADGWVPEQVGQRACSHPGGGHEQTCSPRSPADGRRPSSCWCWRWPRTYRASRLTMGRRVIQTPLSIFH